MPAVDDIAILHITVVIVAPHVAGGTVRQLFSYAVGIPGGRAVGSIIIIAALQETLQFSSLPSLNIRLSACSTFVFSISNKFKKSADNVLPALFLYHIYYFTSSKTTLTDYQCVSTGCCTHVAKTEITIGNQHVTKSLQRYRFLSKQPKENTEKTQDDAKFNMPKGILCIFYDYTCTSTKFPLLWSSLIGILSIIYSNLPSIFSAPIAGRSPIFIFSSRRSVENMASHLDVSNIVKL